MDEDRVYKPEPGASDGVHTSHCCAYHGCKYADPGCPVETMLLRQEHPCEDCSHCEGSRREDPAFLVWKNDFLRYDLLQVTDIPDVLKRAKESLWMDIDKGAVKRILDIIKRKKNPALTNEEKKNVQLNACALSYARWLREHMFVTTAWNVKK